MGTLFNKQGKVEVTIRSYGSVNHSSLFVKVDWLCANVLHSKAFLIDVNAAAQYDNDEQKNGNAQKSERSAVVFT